MIFEIRRTSNKPVDEVPGVFKGASQVWDVRTFKSAADHDARLAEPWLARGTEHQETATGIKRRMPDREVNLIEVSSLEELMELWRDYGELVIGESWNSNGVPCIEIYDDYRE